MIDQRYPTIAALMSDEATVPETNPLPERERALSAASPVATDGFPLPSLFPLESRGVMSGSIALSVLHEILAVIAHGEPQEYVLNLLTEKVCIMTGCASSAVALLDDGGDTLTFVAVAGEQATDLLGSRVLLTDTVAGNTARTGEPYLAFRPTLSANDMPRVESALVLPIFDDGAPVGSITALNKSNNVPFDGQDFLTLSTLATVASVVIGNSRLRQNDQRQSRELTMLNEAVRRVSGQLTAQEILQAVVEQVTKHIENSAVAVFLCNDERTHLYIAGESGLDEDEREVTIAADTGVGRLLLFNREPTLLWFSDEDRPVFLEDLDEARTLVTGSPLFPDRPGTIALAAPIRAGETVHGIVIVLAASITPEQGQRSRQYGPFTNTETNLLTALAAQAAVTLENASLYEEATQRAEEATALYELSQAVSSTLRLPEILERVAEAVLNLVAVDKFALFLRERNSEMLELVFERGLKEGAVERLRPRIGQGIVGWVMEFETPTAVRDIAADPRNTSAPLHTEGAVSLVAMPLQIGSATIGVLTALSSRRRLFTVGEMELLYTIANQAAVAIENARVYSTVRQKSTELRKFFHRVARALSASRTPENIPELIASLTQEVMEADRCALYAVRRGSDGRILLERAASVGFRIEPTNRMFAVVASSPSGWVVQQARPLTVDNLPEDPRFSTGYDHPIRGDVHSYLGVPLRGGSGVIGVLEIYTRERREWQHDDVRLLMTFATQAAVAFQNARLAQEGERSERTARLLERLLSMATRPEPAQPEEIVATLALGLNAPVITLYRDGSGDEMSWNVGPVSSPPDATTVMALRASIARGVLETEEYQIALSKTGNEALAVLHPSSAGMSHLEILETAATLLIRPH